MAKKKSPAARVRPAVSPNDVHFTFLSNHSHVLVLLAAEPDLRLRDLAERVAITERAVQKIVADLEAAGVITREKDGRRNHYHVHRDRPLRHPVESHRTVNDLINMVHGPG
ncbi:MAG: winged helix-turn-helix domain-containing protein [Planctomycetota bacterium]